MDFLLELLSIFGPSGDEAAVSDWVAARCEAISGIRMERIGDNVIAVRGTPRTAVFAHIDTTGWTLGYERSLIRIGSPYGREGDLLRSSDGLRGRLKVTVSAGRRVEFALRKVRDAEGRKAEAVPGSRWVYAAEPSLGKEMITSPYLDNRGGVWAALETLARCENVAVAFTNGEETHGHGARVCGEWLFREDGITQALIADLTWDAKETPVGKGVVVSLRDANCPRQSYLERVLALADASGLPLLREIQDAGSSDGGYLLRSSVPMDWVFVGAPEKRPHTAREKAALADLEAMRDLLIYLVDRL